MFLRLFLGISSCGCHRVLSLGGVGSDDIDADEERSSEINGEGCARKKKKEAHLAPKLIILGQNKLRRQPTQDWTFSDKN